MIRRGRPAADEDRDLSVKRIAVRVTAAERTQLDAAVAATGSPQSEVIRSAVAVYLSPQTVPITDTVRITRAAAAHMWRLEALTLGDVWTWDGVGRDLATAVADALRLAAQGY